MKEKTFTTTWVNMKLVVIVSRGYPNGWAPTTLAVMTEPYLHPACASHRGCSAPISPAHTQGRVLAETRAAAGTGSDVTRQLGLLFPLAHQYHVPSKSRAALTLRWSGLPTDVGSCLWEVTALGQTLWARKGTIPHHSKKQAVCGFEQNTKF